MQAILSGLLLTLPYPAHTDDGSRAAGFQEIQAEWIIETDGISRRKIHSGKFYSPSILQSLYESNSYKPLWSDRIGEPGWLDETAKALAELDSDGLPMWRYHLHAIESLRAQDDADLLLDMYLSDAYINSINDLSGNLILKSELGDQWRMNAETVDIAETISALRLGANPSKTLNALRPVHPQYELLRTAYLKARNSDAPVQVTGEEKLQPGDSGDAVRLLIERLAAEGWLDTIAVDSDSIHYDEAVTRAVKRFQQSRGLEADGIMGRQTRLALNTGPEETARKIALNMHRWRNAPRDIPDSHILVNTAAQRLELVENGSITLEMEVIIGKRSRQTPSFSELMTEVVLNPDWNIPPRIATEEILPKLRENPSFAESQGIRALQGNTPVAWSEISEEQLHSEEFPYRLQQVASDANALGRYKFLFPNPYMVYLHDTPHKGLFSRDRRALSHGCVRLRQPDKLAQHLLAGSGWDQSRIDRRIASGKQQSIQLEQPMPIYIMYLTSWVNDKGQLELFPDTYRQDSPLDNSLIALAKPPAGKTSDVTVANLQMDERREKNNRESPHSLN
ncbi:MAG: L,D-transpeptidase family protein [Gammaproteobacteria bacterium]|nr:L,D-transpeptidase family protein [Gammaproteobacteria bacterium]